MYILKIRKIGDDLGITLPLEVLQKLNIAEGEEVLLVETENGVQISVLHNRGMKKRITLIISGIKVSSLAKN